MITFPIWFEDGDWKLPKEVIPWSQGGDIGVLGFQEDGKGIKRILCHLGLKKGAKKATVSIAHKPTQGYKRCTFSLEDDEDDSRYRLDRSEWKFCREGIEKFFVPFGKGKYKGWVKVK